MELFSRILFIFQTLLLTTTCTASPTASYAPSIAPTTTAYPIKIPTTASPTDTPSMSPSDITPDTTGGGQISARGGVSVGLISALGVGGLAIVISAYVVQKKRMAKSQAIPEIVSEVTVNAV
eukprot:scaffold3132_cov158-Amphora_coffeaeformis.AAC.7